MDRNICYLDNIEISQAVALRKESVDRNEWIKAQYPGCRVALRKESVDRNIKADVSYNIKETSLSARRAWIEIGSADYVQYNYNVALRKESVDRNNSFRKKGQANNVALRKESVDRNDEQTEEESAAEESLSARRAWIEIIDDLEPSRTRKCRSPQGERG